MIFRDLTVTSPRLSLPDPLPELHNNARNRQNIAEILTLQAEACLEEGEAHQADENAVFHG